MSIGESVDEVKTGVRPNPVSILVVDDHETFRKALCEHRDRHQWVRAGRRGPIGRGRARGGRRTGAAHGVPSTTACPGLAASRPHECSPPVTPTSWCFSSRSRRSTIRTRGPAEPRPSRASTSSRRGSCARCGALTGVTGLCRRAIELELLAGREHTHLHGRHLAAGERGELAGGPSGVRMTPEGTWKGERAPVDRDGEAGRDQRRRLRPRAQDPDGPGRRAVPSPRSEAAPGRWTAPGPPSREEVGVTREVDGPRPRDHEPDRLGPGAEGSSARLVHRRRRDHPHRSDVQALVRPQLVDIAEPAGVRSQPPDPAGAMIGVPPGSIRSEGRSA